jgi:excisionase family DNA binding protein
MITLGEAARQCGVSKGTISKAIASGKLSATRKEDSSWSIDAAELQRYVEANRHRFRSETFKPERLETDPATDLLVAELRSVIADLRTDRDAWREQAQRLALPAPKPIEQPLATQVELERPQRMTTWSWLRRSTA